MGEFELRIALAVLVCLVLPISLTFWWVRRRERREDRKHYEALAALTASIGGVVIGRDEATAWSTGLRPPFKTHVGGLINWMGTVRKPRFETALDFRRDGWQVRVSEASMRRAVSNGTSTFYEHRIDVATAPLPPMKLHRRLHTDFRGRPVKPDSILALGGKPVREAPVTVAQQQGQWLEVNLPLSVSTDWVAFSSAPQGAPLTPEALEWLSRNTGALPWGLTFESGLLYATWPTRIQPQTLLTTVDAMLGLLDRIPGARRG
ncbi:hypothetical protein FHX82_000848 [Amycolatopsis bartoniae]|uniref:DUF3137 domain-containing protein n=1 Tax=Amycolatopsis bartoniae TaxID=941986 RepID=A0A8H9J0S0_9PSEU|nr:hypothetical protein [Amycolatopsis bartoniae]MBB2933828.1 hypothetical protein [Amycolatopsis bartoniae]TVT10517.1 hypothetical protein FNH07_04580 [Amycolatopsis bartoniae]GHF87615.1 hypothetical protein GCM10017566_71830 [Amycolatopsis bartoniae]